MNYKYTTPILLMLLLAIPTLVSGQKITLDGVIDGHLASLGTVEKRASIKSLIAVGAVKVEYVTQKNQPAEGRVVVVSEGPKLFLGMSLNASDYPQEKIVHDGRKTEVGFIRSGSRSVLGNFLQSSQSLVGEGVFSGVLTTGWVMGSEEQRSRFSLSGVKKIDNKEVYSLRYTPKGGSDVDITLFFDLKTFQHVRTEYKRTSSASIGRTIDESSRQNESRLNVTEDFSEFKEFQGLTVPRKYKITYTISGNNTTEVTWSCNLSEFAINPKLDPASFAMESNPK